MGTESLRSVGVLPRFVVRAHCRLLLGGEGTAYDAAVHETA